MIRPPPEGIGGLTRGSVRRLALCIRSAVLRFPDAFKHAIPRELVFVADVVHMRLQVEHGNLGSRESLPAMHDARRDQEESWLLYAKDEDVDVTERFDLFTKVDQSYLHFS